VRPLPADPAAEDGYEPLAGFAAMTIPADNPLTPEKAALGRQLYYDSRLSGDGSLSCYSCHTCENGLSDGRSVAVGAYEKVLTRNSPTLWNIGFHSEFYWDGRSPTLEKQASAAWTGANMGAAEPQRVVDALNAIPGYRAQFEAVFGGPATVDNVPMALAAHMRTMIGGNTPWDRHLAGEEDAVSEAAVRGYAVFQQARCVVCHVGVLFTDQQFHNVGAGLHQEVQDVGRFKVTEQKQHTGAFKTPTLRDVAQSGPYFHDGSVDSLEEAVRFMLAGGGKNEFLDPALKPAEVSDEQFADLIAFLQSLDEECDSSEPVLP
jgi:cytochrome c peroxidase